MIARPRRLPARGWLYVPAVSGPVGGGMIKLGRGSTSAAVAVSLAPYAVCALLVGVFMVGYLAALARFLRGRPGEHEAMERLIIVSASAVVSILTLTVPVLPAQVKSAARPPRADALDGGSQAAPGEVTAS